MKRDAVIFCLIIFFVMSKYSTTKLGIDLQYRLDADCNLVIKSVILTGVGVFIT